MGHALDDEEWLRKFAPPEEDRPSFTSAPWRGEQRWFRSLNVVCIERYRRRKENPQHD